MLAPKKKSMIVRFILLCVLFPVITSAQFFSTKNYPQNYFKWPVGATVALAANFGELRPNHYHMGLDCKTDQKENVPVYAAAEGYIAKVKIEPSGFGRAIYINHPNGLTTLYAHLNQFYPALEKYVTAQQYLLKQWKIFIDIPPHLFPVNKGDYIAQSGNTGGSQGPHLHFEIRDTQSDKVLNPLLFGFPIRDNIAPDILRLAIYDRNISTYEQTPKFIPIKKINGIYQPASGLVVVAADKVSFALTAYDRYTGSTNQNGIYRAELFENEKEILGFEMDSIRYEETRYLNAHIDYKTKITGGPFLQHLSMLPGYTNGIYKTAQGEDGVIDVSDGAVHSINIKVTDANNNTSLLKINLKKDINAPALKNTFTGKLFEPRNINVFENDHLQFFLPENCLYDSFHLKYNEFISTQGNTVYQLHNNTVPLQQYFQLKIKEPILIKDSGHVVMKRFFGDKEDYKKAINENGWYKAYFRDFGYYQLLIDTVPPVVTPLFGFRDGSKTTGQNRMGFSVTDNTEEILEFTALLDGKWLRFTNDKGRNFLYIFDEHCPSGEHLLKIIVNDQVGNQTEKSYRFTR